LLRKTPRWHPHLPRARCVISQFPEEFHSRCVIILPQGQGKTWRPPGFLEPHIDHVASELDERCGFLLKNSPPKTLEQAVSPTTISEREAR